MTVITTKKTISTIVDAGVAYGAMLDRICDTLDGKEGGIAPVESLTESIRIMLAGRSSRLKNGVPVRICELSEDDPGFDGNLFESGYAAAARKIYPSGGNALMFAMTSYAVRLCRGRSFETPGDLLNQLLEPVLAYGRIITGRADLRMTFALNALVPVDFAAWVLYAREKGIEDFDSLIPERTRPAMAARQEKLGRIPLITYGLGREEVEKILDSGDFFLKIKIGSDPEGDHDPEKMLEWDKNRLTFLHDLAKERRTPYTENGRLAYYLDANGRYPNRDMLMRFLDHADHIGALSQIVLLEEPLDEGDSSDLSGVPVRSAADESAHCVEDVIRRIEQGYTAVALKPIAKTLSMTFRILEEAHRQGIPCGVQIGVVETNGSQNYRRWDEMCSWHPCAGSGFTRIQDGLFQLDDDFYRCSGGVLKESAWYSRLFSGGQV